MVLFSEVPELSFIDIQGKLASHWPALPPPTEEKQQGVTLSFRLGSSDVILGTMPAAVPWSDLEGPCATSFLWRDAGSVLRTHKAHVIVTISGELDPIALSSLLTQVSASVMDTSPLALGMLWTNAALIVPKALFIDFAVRILPNGPPLDIWVDFRVGKLSEKSSSGFTTGMNALGFMEFETQAANEIPSELRKRFSSLARYLMLNGPVIKDGDTVGENADEQIRVVYSDSQFGNKSKVMRLDYGRASASKPWWRIW